MWEDGGREAPSYPISRGFVKLATNDYIRVENCLTNEHSQMRESGQST